MGGLSKPLTPRRSHYGGSQKVAKATTTKTKKAVAEEVVAVTAEAVVAPIVEEK